MAIQSNGYPVVLQPQGAACGDCAPACVPFVSTANSLRTYNQEDFIPQIQCQYKFTLTGSAGTNNYIFGYNAGPNAARAQENVDVRFNSFSPGSAPTLNTLPSKLYLLNVTSSWHPLILCGISVIKSSNDTLDVSLTAVNFNPTGQGQCETQDYETICPPCAFNNNSNQNFFGFDVSRMLITDRSALLLTITSASDFTATWQGGIAEYGNIANFVPCAGNTNGYNGMI